MKYVCSNKVCFQLLCSITACVFIFTLIACNSIPGARAFVKHHKKQVVTIDFGSGKSLIETYKSNRKVMPADTIVALCADVYQCMLSETDEQLANDCISLLQQVEKPGENYYSAGQLLIRFYLLLDKKLAALQQMKQLYSRGYDFFEASIFLASLYELNDYNDSAMSLYSVSLQQLNDRVNDQIPNDELNYVVVYTLLGESAKSDSALNAFLMKNPTDFQAIFLRDSVLQHFDRKHFIEEVVTGVKP